MSETVEINGKSALIGIKLGRISAILDRIYDMSNDGDVYEPASLAKAELYEVIKLLGIEQ